MAPATYADVLAGNIRAERSRKGLGQTTVVERMRALGFTSWHRQTMGNVERGERRVTADEIYALAWALETSIPTLMKASDDEKEVKFPNGQAVGAVSVRRLASGVNDRAVQWPDGATEPVIHVLADAPGVDLNAPRWIGTPDHWHPGSSS